MNILPQKSWHVRTRKNIERVRRDEAQAAEEEKEKQRRIALAEQEARTDLLRKRARLNNAEHQIEHSADKIPRLTETGEAGSSQGSVESGRDLCSASTSTDIYTHSGHINFFKEIEAGDLKQGKNKEHEAEKAAEKEKWEKDIGLLTYLGQSAVETKEKAPWYLTGRKKDKDELDPVLKDRKLKESLDPLNQMKSYLHKTEHKHKHKHEDKERHHKHKSKKKKKEKDSQVPEKHPSATKTIEQLRAERLNRERQEKQRALDLLSGGHKAKVIEEPINERDRGYNSVFNPDLVRKPKHRHSYEERY